MRSLWLRVPVIVRAVVVGLLAAAVGTVPWAALVSANTKFISALPWAVPLMAAYLWLYWRYLVRGRANARPNRLPPEVWGPALLAGMLGLVGVLLLQGVLGRLVALPQQRELDPTQYPVLTVVMWVLMSGVVAGVVEETSFRGFLQRPIERRHGPVIAILVTGTVFGLVHFKHPEVGLVLLPFYIAAAAVYGALAYVTDSTLPGMILHAGGNMFSAFDLFARGRSEWQLTTEASPLIWETGPDAAFWGNVAALLIVAALTAWAYHALARAARRARAVEAGGVDRRVGSQVRPVKVLFACVHNAGRSQMAAAFFNALAPAGFRAISAGTRPAAAVHPEVVAVMSEVGLDLSSVAPRKLTQAVAEEAGLLITMGCGEECPHVPGLRRLDWAIPDPKGKSLEAARVIRAEIRRRVVELVEELSEA